jgi:hypothetical protein
VSTVLFNTVDTPLLSSPFHASLIDEKTSNSSVNSAAARAALEYVEAFTQLILRNKPATIAVERAAGRAGVGRRHRLR